MKKIVEINGNKVEIDLSEARVIETYKIGDNVKVFAKEYGNTIKVYPGIITGFITNGSDMNAMEITILKHSYSSAELVVIYMTDKPDDTYTLASFSSEESFMNYERVVEMLQRDIQKKQFDLAQAKDRFRFIEQFFGETMQLFDLSEKVES